MTSFKYMGKFKDESSLPTRVQEGAVKFKEPEMNKFVIIMNLLSVGILILCVTAVLFRADFQYDLLGPVVAVVLIIPHELLHAIWMKGEVFMYDNLKKGMFFVVSKEDLTKGQFIWMSLFPTIVFGFIPFTLFLIQPQLLFLGSLGACSISMGAGDFCNIYFALTQMPKGALTFLSGFHSYWYMPEK